jgi:Glycosyl transferases group 1
MMETTETNDGTPGDAAPWAVGTIAARNYLASVLLLAGSLKRVHPEITLEVVVLDATGAELEEYRQRWGWVAFRNVFELEIPAVELDRMLVAYSITELATAVKPSLLRVLRRRAEVAMYLDPDIEVYASLEPLVDAARTSSLALTPHVLAPSPRDFKDTSEEAFLTTGQFNLGFVAVGPGSEPFLDYWAERLVRHAVVDFSHGYFTDQRWVDAVPSLFEHAIIRDPGCNVAYWNLHQRVLSEGPQGLAVDGGPLRFFHFSGHDARRPEVLSKYAPLTRVEVAKDPALRKLLVDRAERLGALELPEPDYGFDRLPDGRRLVTALRRGYWWAWDQAVRAGSTWPPAPDWSIGSTDDFDAYLAGQARCGLPRQALLYWHGDEEARRLFPDPERYRTEAFASWLAGRSDFVASADAPMRRRLEQFAHTDRQLLVRGANVVGYLGGEFGMGEHARAIAAGVRAAGYPMAGVVLDAPGHSHRATLDHLSTEAHFGANLVVVNADVLGSQLVHSEEWAALQPRATAGVWAWELPSMPAEMARASRALDEVWCGSSFVRSALVASGVEVPVHVHPWLVEEPATTHLLRADLGIPEDRFCFGFAFDVRSVARRKNPMGLLDAYLEGFAEAEGAALVLKVLNGGIDSTVSQLRARAEGRSDVVIIDQLFTTTQMRALFQLLDAYVSLHRSEGTGLTLLSAMAAGTPVVATGYSGNLDFMDASVAKLVACELVEVGPGIDPYPADALWAEPNRAAAIDAMRQLFEDPAGASDLGVAGARHVRQRCSRTVVGAWFAEHLASLLGEGAP